MHLYHHYIQKSLYKNSTQRKYSFVDYFFGLLKIRRVCTVYIINYILFIFFLYLKIYGKTKIKYVQAKRTKKKHVFLFIRRMSFIHNCSIKDVFVEMDIFFFRKSLSTNRYNMPFFSIIILFCLYKRKLLFS